MAVAALLIAGCATAGEGSEPGPGYVFDAGAHDAALPHEAGRDAKSSAPPPPAFDADSGPGATDDAAAPPPQANDAGVHDDAASPPPPPPPPADAGSGCVDAPGSTCGLAPQCGCSGATPTCDITTASTGAAQCVAAGSTPVRDACRTTQDCAPGLTCWGGACRQYCSTDGAACSGPGMPTTCKQEKNAQGQIEPNMLVCRFACNLDDPNACGGVPASGPVAGCIIYTDNGTDCRALGRGKDGATCNGPADCAPGYACASAFLGNACAPWCRVAGGGPSCNPNLYIGCQGFNPKVVVNGVEFGACN